MRVEDEYDDAEGKVLGSGMSGQVIACGTVGPAWSMR